MEKLDMTGVDPLRYAEMRRRVATVKAFLALKKPTAADREAAALDLGIGTKHFMRLVAAWQGAGSNARAADLDCSTSGKGQRRRIRSGLTQEVRTMVAATIEEHGADAPLREIVSAVRLEAGRSGIKPPSRPSIWNMLMEARSNQLPATGQSGILTGTVEAKLPVEIDGMIVRPVIAVAICAASGAIVDHEVSFDPQTPPRLTNLRNCRDLVPPIVQAAPPGDAAGLSRILGSRIGRLGIIHNPKLAAPAAALIRSRRDAPIEAADALRVTAQAIGEHNKARSQKAAAARAS